MSAPMNNSSCATTPRSLHFIRGMLKDDHMSEDIAQNIFMKLWIHREKLDSTQSVKNYLFVLAKHEIYNIFKAKRTTMLSLPQLSDRDGGPRSLGRGTIQLYGAECAADAGISNAAPATTDLPHEPLRTPLQPARSPNGWVSVRTVDKHIELALKDLPQLALLIFRFFSIFLQFRLRNRGRSVVLYTAG